MFNFLKNKIKGFSHKVLNFKSTLGLKIKDLFSKEIQEDSFEELEKILYEADLGVNTSLSLVEIVKKELKNKKKNCALDVLDLIKKELLNILPENKEQLLETTPQVIMVVGVNGSGKTTSIAKLAAFYKEQGKKVLIVAADTFRAAAVDQLALWAEKIDVPIIKSQIGADPASVVFDALAAAKNRNIDLVLIDTAGRLQNKTELMYELEKIKRICKKQIEEAPHKIYLTLDASIGQNALDQASTFNQFTPIDGIILTKLEGTAKGGIIIAIQKELKIPVVWVGTGEKLQDLIVFDPELFIEKLLTTEE